MNSINSSNLYRDHPRYESLKLRARMVEAYKAGILSDSGLIAHGRGEAFDYFIGEKTTSFAKIAIHAAAAALILAEYPVISINGNTAALSTNEMVKLAQKLHAELEINLFYRTPQRVAAVEKVLKEAGAGKILGTEEEIPVYINGLNSPRSRASRDGVYKADVVLVPLEDGDRAEALVSNGKLVITVDLNPLSRTSKTASISIVDNLIRVMPELLDEVDKLKDMDPAHLKNIVNGFDNPKNIQGSLKLMARNYISP